LKKLFTEYIQIIYTLIIIFALVRLSEVFYIWFEYNKSFSIDLLFGRSINFDSLFLINLGYILLLPIMVIGFFHKKTAMYLIRIFASLIILIHLILTSYFIISWDILNISVLEFSFKELSKIVLFEFSLQNLSIWIGFLTIGISSIYLFFKLIPNLKLNKKVNISLAFLFVLFGVVALINRKHTFKSIKYFDNNYQYLLGNSKEVFFIKSIEFSNSKTNFNIKEVKNATQNYQSANPHFKYCKEEYPFIHNEPYSNVLGKYFVKDTIPPNIVIIISESLSSSFSGKNNCIKGSLTPFIDSLSSHSLYWENFLSNAERSYGVLPNVLSSLPSGIGNRGFINMDIEYSDFRKYPSHSSIIELLKRNGYTTSYFYGGWGYFDNVGYFIKENKIDNFISEDDFDNSIYQKPDGEMVWGYNDKDLFSQSFKIIDEKNIAQPFLNIYQTLSLHSPFNLSEKKYYSEKFLTEWIEQLGLNPKNLEKIPKNILSSIIFSDDALRYYFNLVKKRKEFSNTIFIITGDHSLDISLCNNAFAKYRVPLIIYSELLTSPAVFKGVCSHIDILPSIIALLQNNFGLNFSNSKHWIGQGLDTSRFFNAERNIPLVINSKFLPQYISGSNVIYKNDVYRFDSLFNIHNESIRKEKDLVEKIFKDYLLLNNYVCTEDKIWIKEKTMYNK